MAKDSVKKEKKHFFKDFKAELKKVIWPTTKQIVNSTVAVISIVLITTVIVFTLDLVFETFNTYGIDKLRDIVKKEEVVNEIDGNVEGEDNIEIDFTEEAETESDETNNSGTEVQ